MSAPRAGTLALQYIIDRGIRRVRSIRAVENDPPSWNDAEQAEADIRDLIAERESENAAWAPLVDELNTALRENGPVDVLQLRSSDDPRPFVRMLVDLVRAGQKWRDERESGPLLSASESRADAMAKVVEAAQAWVHSDDGIFGTTLAKLNAAVAAYESTQHNRPQGQGE